MSAQSQPIAINNKLSKCISFSDLKVSLDGVVPVAEVDLSVDKPISECGCKSALGSYNVYQKNENYRSYVLGGKISLRKSGSKVFPLSAEVRLIKDKKLK